MLQSLTAYGSAKIEVDNTVYNLEIRTLNSGKGLDLNVKLPLALRDKENIIRQALQNKLERGKIDLWINEEKNSGRSIKIDDELAKFYIQKFKDLAQSEGVEIDLAKVIATVMKLPEVIIKDESNLNIGEEVLLEKLDLAIQEVINFRKAEGAALQKDIVMRVEKIASLLKDVEKFEGGRIIRIKERIQAALQNADANVNQDRLEQELIFYIEKLDITEEKVRLSNHCKYFKELINENESQGKKLGFLSQELGREINTIGSKANDSDLQKIVVQMKDELEKIKEQLLNIL